MHASRNLGVSMLLALERFTRALAVAPFAGRRARLRPFNLLSWFSICSFAVICAGGVAMGTILGSFISSHMVMRDADVSRDFIESIVATEDSFTSFTLSADDRAKEALGRFVLHIPTLPGVVNANLYALDGTVLWSSEPSLVGQRFPHNDELDSAVAGRIVVSTGTFNPKDAKEEHLWIRDRQEANPDRRYVEQYLPIRDKARENVVAVVEIYKLPRTLFQSIDRGVRLVWVSTATLGIVLYAAMFWLVLRANGLIRQQQERLVQSEALSAVGEMTAAAAHSIRNPLASIRSAAELAQEEEGPDLDASLRDIIGQADRIDGWIREMLAACSEGSLPLERVDLATILDGCLAELAGAIRTRAIAVAVAVPEDLAARGSRATLLHALRNIVANAVDAMPDGGTLTIAGTSEGRLLRLDISDTGLGMSLLALKALFKPFFTTKPNGTGLGLSLTRRIVERHGGSVEIVSHEGRGTTVSVFLPREV